MTMKEERRLRQSLHGPKKAPVRSEASEASAATVAKWLVPSASALFIMIGYIIRAAHVSFLGNDFGDVVPVNYPAHAAEFFRDLATVVFDFFAAWWNGDVGMSVHSRLELIVAAALGIAGVVLVKFPRKDERLRFWLIGTTLLFAVCGKFLLFDAPLALIEEVAVAGAWTAEPVRNMASSNAPWSAAAAEVDDVSWRAVGNNNFIARRSQQLWKQMKCRRMGASMNSVASKGYADVLSSTTPLSKCSGGDGTRDEFVMQVVTTGLIGALAYMAFRSHRRTLIISGVLAFFYCLTLPYSYGKLLKSTDFQYGRIEFAEPVGAIVRKNLRSNGVNGMVLGSGQGMVSFLIMNEDYCPGDNKLETYREAKIWTVAANQVLDVREIYREDIIRWKIIREKQCPEVVP